MAVPLFPVYEQINGEARYHEHPALKLTDAERAAGVTPVNYAWPPLHLYRYGASTTAADNSAAIQAALDVANAGGGGEVIVPQGTFNYATSLTIYKHTTLSGQGRQASILQYTGLGDGINSAWAVNSSVAVWIKARNLGLSASNASNAGGGFVDVGGTFVDLDNVAISGFLHQIIFDQTEIATIRNSQLTVGATKVSCIWLVNGPDHTPALTFTAGLALAATSGTLTGNWTGATGTYNINFVETVGGASEGRSALLTNGSTAVTWIRGLSAACNAATTGANTFFTNRITIDNNQFNAGAGADTQILDDGGVAHTIINNNFNAGETAALISGVFGLKFSGNYSEGHTVTDIVLSNLTNSGAAVEPCTGMSITGNTLISDGVAYNIHLVDAAGGEITGNVFGQADAGITIEAKATGVLIESNSKIVTGTSPRVQLFVSATADAFRQNIVRQTPQTYVSSALGATGSQTVTPAVMEFIHVGSRLSCRNQDNSNFETVIVIAVTSTTFTAVFASTKTARWSVHGFIGAQEEEGTWVPVMAGTTIAGTNTYSASTVGTWQRRGNLVHVKGVIDVTAKPVAMTGNLKITGLPFTAENVTSQFSMCHLAGFAGFTFGGGPWNDIGGLIAAGASEITLNKAGSGVAFTNLPVGDIPGAAFSLYFDAVYYTSSL